MKIKEKSKLRLLKEENDKLKDLVSWYDGSRKYEDELSPQKGF